MLFNGRAQFELAVRLRNSGAPLGEIYSFISGLYFRGKLAYALSFSNPPPGVAGIHIITPAAGLLPPAQAVTLPQLRVLSSEDVHSDNHFYRGPLNRDALRLRDVLDSETEIVLLGSIASPKYVEPLLEVFGKKLVFPEEFVGRGDMSRGGLLLRSCGDGLPLRHIAVLHAVRHGKRPARLTPMARSRSAAR
jgi:hypothetical protein